MLSMFLLGWRPVRVPIGCAAPFLELCRRAGCPYTHFTCTDEYLSVQMTCAAARRCEAVCARACVPAEFGAVRGLPDLGRRMLQRPGVPVGILLGIVLLWLSGQYVWDIRISGVETLSRREVLDTLASCGFSVGTPLRGFAADRLENRVLLEDRRIAWISVNRRGTVAYVQVREAVYPPAPTEPAPANIVASRPGVIERVELTRGNILVAAGQTVDAGQLLVSGLYDSQTVGVRAVCAEAHIYARTTRREVVEIPLRAQARSPSGVAGSDTPAGTEKYLIFFGKSIKFSKRTGNQDVVCDTIEQRLDLTLVPGIGFPVAVRTVWYVPAAQPAGYTRTPAEAEALAYLELSRRIAAIPGGAELLSKTVCPILTEDAFILDVTLTCVEDIALSVPIRVDG